MSSLKKSNQIKQGTNGTSENVYVAIVMRVIVSKKGEVKVLCVCVNYHERKKYCVCMMIFS